MPTGLKRRKFLKNLSYAGMSLGMGGGSVLSLLNHRSALAQPNKRSHAKPMNVILIVSDDMRHDSMGCAGNPIIQTPHMDRLAADGTRFENNFCTAPICGPSRASIFTGQHVCVHGQTGFQGILSPEQQARSYPALMREAGYHTGFIGKYHFADDDVADKKFDYWRGWYDPDYFMYYSKDGLQEIHLTEVMGYYGLEFLMNAPRDKPFCLSINFKAPHVGKDPESPLAHDPKFGDLYADKTMPVPLSASESHWETLPGFLRESEMRRRWEMRHATDAMHQETVRDFYRLVTGMDEAIGEIRQLVEEMGLGDDTIFIMTSDNGMLLGEHGLASKQLIYEDSIRTPLIIMDPRLEAGRRGLTRPQITQNIDLAPTLCDIAGIKTPEAMNGVSMMPLVHEPENTRWREHGYFETWFKFEGFPMWSGIRTDRWKYCRYPFEDEPNEQLFDLLNDPHEMANLAYLDDYRQVLEAMRGIHAREQNQLNCKKVEVY